MKKHFNEEHVMTKENFKGVKNSTKCLICDNKYVDSYVKLKDHYHITGKHRNSALGATISMLK